MKSRISLYIFIIFVIIVVGGIWFFSAVERQESMSVFPATVNRDCAPWDGPAFTVSIPVSDGAIVSISIYRSPDIKLPVSFSFPDETLRDGNALLLLPVGLPEQLTGRVTFWRVKQGSPVDGQFDLYTETGQRLRGKFRAGWEKVAAYCG